MERPTIRVRYCGGCNPEIERGQLVKEVTATLAGEVSFSQTPSPDLWLLVNGCPHACLDEELAGKLPPARQVSVQGYRVDFRPVCGTNFVAAVASRVRKKLKRA
ncbi:MAG: hypothetical protein K9K88_07785 [Desulfobacterales bacterium]|nr:hypothetical protein [Desulfobacterales bacterium]